jgi:hypothetical protein
MVNFLKTQLGIQNVKLVHEWILFLDADEFVTEAFVDGNQNSNLNYNGYTIQFENYLWVKLRYGCGFQKSAL